MAKKKNRRTKAKRRNVSKVERVAATPETLKKLKPCNLAYWLQRGPEDGGISARQHGDLSAIAEAWGIMSSALDYGSAAIGEATGKGAGDMPDSVARLWAIWIVWARELKRRFGAQGVVVAGMIRGNADIPPHFLPLLCRAADLWSRCCEVYDRDQRTSDNDRHTIMRSGNVTDRRD